MTATPVGFAHCPGISCIVPMHEQTSLLLHLALSVDRSRCIPVPGETL